jgi:proline iminopeptidase
MGRTSKMSAQINCEEGFFQTGAGKVYYLIYKSENSTGIPLILAHGGPGFTHHYLEPLYTLANERPVVFYDQLGCGKSDRPENLSYLSVPYFVDELAALIKHLNFGEVNLLGHSWGCVIAAEYAISHKNISHLILASPYMSSPLWNADIKKYIDALPPHMKSAIESKNYTSPEFMEAYHEYYTRHVYGKAQNDRAMQLSSQSAGNEVYETLWGPNEFEISGILKNYDCTERIEKISAKTLFTCGESDTGSPRACKIMSSKIKDSKMQVFKGCAHFPHLEKKAEYIGISRNFLNDSPLKPGFFQSLIRSN